MERTFNRRERRKYQKELGMHRVKKQLLYRKRITNKEGKIVTVGFEDWCELLRENKRAGDVMHQKNVEKYRKILGEKLSTIESNKMANFKEAGFGDDWIKVEMHKWGTTVKIWNEEE